MAVKPQNTLPVLKDKKIVFWWDLSAGLAVAGGTGLKFLDSDNAYQVISVKVQPTVTLTSTATTITVGTVATPNKFVTSVDVAATAGNRVVGVTQTLTLTSTVLLPADTPLVLTSTGTANTGEALVTVTLRPVEKARGNATKRPGADADATV
jgi:hypothetical protein